MANPLLLQSTVVLCPHGGAAQAIPSQVNARARDLVMVEGDTHMVAGCIFTLPGPKPSPCVRIEWSGGAASTTLGGKRALTHQSIGRCLSPEGAPQGVAIIVGPPSQAGAL
ncbi:MAG: hypothetical protein H6710_20355 [Myxococcales bacterium]|nr:hypothetical protein [Myxococcales bacterium]MCB9706296.1 hypothetical protein [Myxococcales bacterium]